MMGQVMEQLILWFNILGFTLLFGSLGTTHVLYRRTRPPWLGFYLLYLAVYAFYTIVNTYGFFSQVYLPPAAPLSSPLTLTFSFLTALVLLLLVPRFILSLFGEKITVKQRLWILLMASFFLAMVVMAVIKPAWPMDRVGSVYMNIYLGLMTLLGVYRLGKLPDRSSYGVIVPFLGLSGAFYFLVALQTMILPVLIPPALNLKISILTAGIICFLWGAVTLGYQFLKPLPETGLPKAVLTDSFALRFGLTPREKEIIGLLLKGKSNREIGEELYVSPRTVEAHVYNIYRKCGVKNKMELAVKVSHTP